MNFLKKIVFLLACGLGSLARRDYLKGSLFVLGFWSAIGLMVWGIQADGAMPFVFVPAGAFLFVFVWVYNALETFDNKGTKRKKCKVEHEWQELYNHGIAFYLKKDYWGAEESFKRILVNNRKDADVYFQLGKLYMKKKDPKNAKKMLRKYLSFDVEGKWEQEAEGYLAELQSGEPLPLSPLL